MTYFVYLLECKDKSLYCGIAKDVKKRLAEHEKGKGSRFVRSRLPAKIVYTEKAKTRSKALKREAQIKKMKREKKRELFSAV
ncbi:MAG: GIY-YIG nuclease family protein [Candidatus Diapherotrites archaeon]